MQDIILFVFRRDLRIHDNTTFIETVKMANEHKWKIMPVFIFNPLQIDPSQNKYFSNNCVQFMIQSLKDLNEQLKIEGGKLYYFNGSDKDTFDAISKDFTIKAIASNKDITQFALKRDENVQYWCDKKGIPFVSKEDYTMYPIEHVRTNQGKPFEIYTQFYRRSIRIPVPEPHCIPEITTEFVLTQLDNEENQDTIDKYYTFNEFVEQKGGRETGLEILEHMRTGGFKKYKKEKDYPIKDATTKIGAYLKFGCVSIRETFKIAKEAYGKESQLIMSLYSREFYYNLAYHFPEILKGQLGEERSTPLHGRYEKSTWNTDEEALEKWKTGQTGYPIVDAAMRCLNKTGWLHGRMRMMVAMFLVRDLDIDWRTGEQYMAQQLVDYDPPSNSQGWCWVLSYRRKFNPYKQTGKYDEQCEFVKKWVPELAEMPVLDLICWWEKCVNYPDMKYPMPMVAIQGYRVKFKTYIPDYVRPKDPNYVKIPKKSKYGLNKNKEKYDKNKERNKLRKQQLAQIPVPQARQTSQDPERTINQPFSPRVPFIQPPRNHPFPQRLSLEQLPPPPPLERVNISYQSAPPGFPAPLVSRQPPPPPPRDTSRYAATFPDPPPGLAFRPQNQQYQNRQQYQSRQSYQPRLPNSRPPFQRTPPFISDANRVPIGRPETPPNQTIVPPTNPPAIIIKKKNGKKRDPNRPPYVAPYQPAFTIPPKTSVETQEAA
jgi:deoxyribodipyrimidine photo-lyase